MNDKMNVRKRESARMRALVALCVLFILQACSPAHAVFWRMRRSIRQNYRYLPRTSVSDTESPDSDTDTSIPGGSLGSSADTALASPTGLTVEALSPTRIELRWTDNTGSSDTKFEIQREISGQPGVFETVVADASVSASSSRKTYIHDRVTVTSLGYRVKAYYASTGSAPSDTAWAPPKLRIVNDLYNIDATDAAGNDYNWTQWNSIICLRIGPNLASVNNDGYNIYERLTKWDAIPFSSGLDEVIEPVYNQFLSYRDFGLTSNGPNYVVFWYCGWWEFNGYTSSWIKRFTIMGNNTYKATAITVSGHRAGYHVQRVSRWMPNGDTWGGW